MVRRALDPFAKLSFGLNSDSLGLRVRNLFTAINVVSVALEGSNPFATVINVACAFPSLSLKHTSA